MKFNNESKLFLVQVFFPSSTNLRQAQLSIEYDLAFFLFTRFYSIETWIFIIIISRHGARTSLQRRIRWRGWPIIELPSVIGTKDADLFFCVWLYTGLRALFEVNLRSVILLCIKTLHTTHTLVCMTVEKREATELLSNDERGARLSIDLYSIE